MECNKLQDKQLKSHPQKNVESEILREHIKKEREAAKAGKRPYYLKKCEFLNPMPPSIPHYLSIFESNGYCPFLNLMATPFFLNQLNFAKGSL